MADFSCYDGTNDEWLAVEATLPAGPIGGSAIDFRTMANGMREAAAASAMKVLAPLVHIKDYSIPTRDGFQLEARTYRPASVDQKELLPVYYHLHGGGFLLGTLASEDATCARVASESKVLVLNVNYRHTPEYVYPTPWNDAFDAFDWLAEHIKELGGDASKVVVGGISAGAQLAASLTLQQKLGAENGEANRLAIAGQLLMIPCLTHIDCPELQLKKLKDPSVSSYVTNADAPVLPMQRLKMFMDLLQITGATAEDTGLSPGSATPEQAKGLPPTVFGIAGYDPLRDDGLFYAKTLTEAGVPTDIHLFKGLPHGFRRFGDKLSASAAWDKVMQDGILWTLSNPSPSGEFLVKVK